MPQLAAGNSVALANKIARMAWAMMVRGRRFKEPRFIRSPVPSTG
jgi:hypothetical protein